MLEKKIYLELMDSLRDELKDSSDMVNAELTPYGDYFTQTGKWDSRKSGFQVTIVISYFYLSTQRAVSVVADTFSRITSWMEKWEDRIYFSDYNIKPVGGANSRMEVRIVFDDITDSAKRLLLR